MSLKIVTYPNPLLGKPSLPITEVTDEIRKLAEEMTEAMYKSDGIGIAAPQVGRLIRLVIIDVTGPEKREGKMVLVNPVWTPLPDAGYVESEEGCLSVPDYRSKVRRTARVQRLLLPEFLLQKTDVLPGAGESDVRAGYRHYPALYHDEQDGTD